MPGELFATRQSAGSGYSTLTGPCAVREKRKATREARANKRASGERLMDLLERQLNRLRNFNAWVAENDPRLFEEAVAVAEAAKAEMPARELALTPETLGERMRQESIVLRTTRPVLAIKQNVTQLEFKDGVDSETWKERLAKAEGALTPAIRAVGRINLTGSDVAWVRHRLARRRERARDQSPCRSAVRAAQR